MRLWGLNVQDLRGGDFTGSFVDKAALSEGMLLSRSTPPTPADGAEVTDLHEFDWNNSFFF